MDKKIGLLAASAAAMLVTAPVAFAGNGPKLVKGHYCQNNTCKGKSSCGGHGNKNGCAGQNSCKGKGWLDHKDKASCEAGGGKWAKAKKKKKK